MEFKFYYGGGKTTEILLKSYSLTSISKNILIMDGDNKEYLQSKIKFKMIDGKVLVNFKSNNIYNDIKKLGNIDKIFVDNASSLSIDKINDLYKACKLLNIPIELYGTRDKNGIRCMELADEIIKLNDFNFQRKGSDLTFYYGTMNSGKTVKLIGNLEYLSNYYNTCLMKPITDRDKHFILSRLGLSKRADFVIYNNTYIKSLIKNTKYNCILIDEIQFLSKYQIMELKDIVLNYHIPIIGYGLKTDFMTNSFIGSEYMLRLADNIIKIDGQCALCGNQSNFNARYKKDTHEYINIGNQVEVDGINYNYDPLCPNCYIKHVLKLKK